MQPMAGQEEPEVPLIPTSLDTGRLHALFSEYEKLVKGRRHPVNAGALQKVRICPS